jgi:parvulin-like peptidyl-prolyl isomerase
MFPCNFPRVTGRRTVSGLVLVFLASVFLLAGCGGKDGGDKSGGSTVLATVGDTDITAEMYETGLAKMEKGDLPVDDLGQPVDTATQAGKQEFLEVLINKELLRQKALQLGYDQDPQALGAKASLEAYHGGIALWEAVVGQQGNTISEEELQAFYANMGVSRLCNFVICNFEDDAAEASEFARTGADWEEVVEKFHDGAPAPSGRYEIKVPFGQYGPSFEDEIYRVAVGEVTNPVRTSYGFWVLRVLEEKQGEKPSLEEAKAQILDVTRNRKIGRAREDFKLQMREDHKLFMDEDVLWICYQGLPENGIMDPETNKPFAKEDLEPLNVAMGDLDRLFYSYELNGELVEQTLGDYKGHFDNMSVFQRPKKSDMLGGLREHLIGELERGMVNEEAEKRGYYDDPAVVAKVAEKVEEVMVTKLYGDVVQFDDRVSVEEIEAFYNDNASDFEVPEIRGGRIAICLNEEEAAKAKAAVQEDRPWRGILREFDVDRENKGRGGKLPGVASTATGPLKDAIYGLEMDQVSDPFPLDNGRYGIVILESIQAPRVVPLDEVREQIGQRIRNLRKEASFQDLLAKWTAEFGVTRHDENLASVASWEELTAVVKPENLVPRN